MLKQIIFLAASLIILSSVSFAQKACCTKDKSTYEKASTEQVDLTKAADKNHCDVDTATKTSEAKNQEEVKAELTVFNAVCPVMGNPVDLDGAKVEYDGKLYAFCCAGCETKFASNPQKFLKNLSEDGKTFLGKKKS